MSLFRAEISDFRRRKNQESEQARQRVACLLLAGIDLPQAIDIDPGEKQRLRMRLERLVERERLRGMRRHWSYDLNRHIALKQILDRLRSEPRNDCVVHNTVNETQGKEGSQFRHTRRNKSKRRTAGKIT